MDGVMNFQGFSPMTFSKVPPPKVSVTFSNSDPVWRPCVQIHELIWGISPSNYHNKNQTKREFIEMYFKRARANANFQRRDFELKSQLYKRALPVLKILQGWLITEGWNIPCADKIILAYLNPPQQPFIICLCVWTNSLVTIRWNPFAYTNKPLASTNPKVKNAFR